MAEVTSERPAARTPYSETEALLLAMDDLDADSGNHDPLDDYLAENFLPNELRTLSNAASLLASRCYMLEDGHYVPRRSA